jgi:hypothetical protein
MRRALMVVLFVMLLLAIDAVFNEYRFTAAIYRGVLEFARLVNRTIDEMF